MEAWDFLQGLGLDLPAMNVSRITRLQVSGVNGRLLEQQLPSGGFGISRYRLDHALAGIARKAGVVIEENVKVNDLVFGDAGFDIEASRQHFKAVVVCGCHGKRSNMDIRWKRSFITATKNKLNNYIGVKYHIRSSFPADTIALHNFKNGYCGIVKIEDDKYNLCYLTTAANLQGSKGMIPEMERTILSENPHLRKIFAESEILFDSPVTISQISFDKKTQVEDHVLMIGDATGMITPLCGNGMSMALHGSKIAAGYIHRYLQGKITRSGMEQQYAGEWQNEFARRMQVGRLMQRLLGSKGLTNMLISFSGAFPGFMKYLVRQTHGDPF